MKKTLILELWGLGDAVIMTSLLRTLAPTGREIFLLCKPGTRTLLQPSFPRVSYISITAPWTAFRQKYRLWRWPWLEMIRLLRRLRNERFDEALSVRADPRDHLLLWLVGARCRYGFPRAGSALFLNRPILKPVELRHRVEDWYALAQAAAGPEIVLKTPRLEAASYASHRTAGCGTSDLPVFALHLGAGQPVRRWPIRHFLELIPALRYRYQFHLLVIPDTDGFGRELQEVADTWVDRLSIQELVVILTGSTLFIGNDSGPAHIAASLGIPVIAFFGPQHPELFAPRGSATLIVNRDLCVYRPCFDRCRFKEPFCMTRMVPTDVSPEICAYIEKLREKALLPSSILTPRSL